MSSGGDRVVDPYRERRRRNEESKAWADHDGEPWSQDEDDFLIAEWIDIPSAARDERTISQVLGRTIEACRVRCEHIRAQYGISNRRTVEIKMTTTTVEYRGLMDDPDDQWWSPDYYRK